MNDVLDGPADTAMMGIVHSALRRDLARVRLVLAEDLVREPRRTVLAEHVVWMMQFLHEHHHGEDTGLFPLALARDPSLAELVADMDVEHEAIAGAMAAVTAAARSWRGGPGEQQRLTHALESLEDVLLPHLAHEESVLMPRIAGVLTQREWLAWDQETNVKPKKPTQLAFEGHWLIDGAPPEIRAKVVSLVPPVPRFVLVHLLGGPYRRRRAALWDGTAAA
jgi:hemerythrin-like domain-containing protein